jgi:hypothetical protein
VYWGKKRGETILRYLKVLGTDWVYLSAALFLEKAKILKVLFYSILSDFRKSLAVWQVPSLCRLPF